MSTQPAPSGRIASLDQFRGYTVAGMFLVNFLGGYGACPFLWRHHNTFCSYADTIMPHFFFAVGFAYRLTFGRRVQTEGIKAAYWRVVKRLLGLALVAIVVYGADDAAETWSELMEVGPAALIKPLKSSWFQTLMHIAVTSLWILPVIRAGALARIGYMIVSALLHVGLSYWFYFHWVHADPRGIDGGPLGFLSWSIPMITGTLACDAIAGSGGRASGGTVFRMAAWSVLLMGLGYALSCGTRLYDVPPELVDETSREKLADDPVVPPSAAREAYLAKLKERDWKAVLAEPPFVPPPHSRSDEEEAAGWSRYVNRAYWTESQPRSRDDDSFRYRRLNYWMMSQRAGSISYHIFAAGLSLAVYVLFYLVSDVMGLKIGVFRTLGVNALVGYVLHGIVDSSISAFMPNDVPGWYMFAGFAVYFYITWLFLRVLEKNRIYVKL